MSRAGGAAPDSGGDPLLQSLAEISRAIRLDVLLASIPLHAKRLIVIPHGTLCGVPFSALPCDAKPGQGPEGHTSPTYLLDRFALGVVCVHSLKMLQWCEDRGANLRFAPLLQGMALHRQSAGRQHADGKENARLDAEYACLRKSLGKLSIEHQVRNRFACRHMQAADSCGRQHGIGIRRSCQRRRRPRRTRHGRAHTLSACPLRMLCTARALRPATSIGAFPALWSSVTTTAWMQLRSALARGESSQILIFCRSACFPDFSMVYGSL